MIETKKISVFEVIVLIVGIAAAFLGFQLINEVYTLEKQISWSMVSAIFSLLMLLVLFILLSIGVDISKKQLAKTEIIIYLLNRTKGKKL
ncbi:hypothetical protein HYW19_03175 [Candidatus Woesearchaeota archaeon]|nr:hypothetical protein [Candidatus Woesearchaeota archaeon]